MGMIKTTIEIETENVKDIGEVLNAVSRQILREGHLAGTITVHTPTKSTADFIVRYATVKPEQEVKVK